MFASLVIFFGLAAALVPATGSQDLCFVPGTCHDSTQVGISFQPSSNDCLADCLDNPNCFYFTYTFEDDVCVNFLDCDELVNTDSNQTVTGQGNCDPLECDLPGECQGTILGYDSASNATECLNLCAARPDCAWYSFVDDQGFCFYFGDCLRVSDDCQDCTYGQRMCKEGATALGSRGKKWLRSETK